MTTLTNRPGTALVVVDMQNRVVADVYRRDEVIANINALVAKARKSDVPVVWVQHSDEELTDGSQGWQFVRELSPDPAEPLVHKGFADAFEDTDLEDVLAAQQVGRLVLAGAQTDECIRSTLHGAMVRGYDVTLVGDAHTTEDLSPWGAPKPELVIAHTNLYWGNHRAPGRTADVVPTAEVSFGEV